MRKLIVVLLGGLSGERKISLLTGKACSKALRKKGYKVKEIDAKGHFLKDLQKLKPKAVSCNQLKKCIQKRYGCAECGAIVRSLVTLSILLGISTCFMLYVRIKVDSGTNDHWYYQFN